MLLRSMVTPATKLLSWMPRIAMTNLTRCQTLVENIDLVQPIEEMREIHKSQQFLSDQ